MSCRIGGSCRIADAGGMERARSQKVYDHRLKSLVRETGDIHLAIDNRVPRSTACGWISASAESVVTLDVFDARKSELEREVLRLRKRNQLLATLLRIPVVAMKVTEFSLAGCRLPAGRKKAQILSAIERSRNALPLRKVLCLLKVSGTRYHSSKRADEICDLDDQSSCPKTSPHRLTPAEIQTIRNLVTSLEHRHVPTGTLAILGPSAVDCCRLDRQPFQR